MFKFIHAADIHLDSPLRGLDRYDGAPVDDIRQATRRALESLVQLAIDEEVAFVLIAGDLYDGDWRDYNTGLFFVKECTRLREVDIPVFLIAGNHDAANRMTRSLKLPANVTLFPHRSPETSIVEDYGVAIHGQSFATAAIYDDLSAEYPSARKGMFNIGLLHTSATGREGHEAYAPCTVDGLRLKGYDYWCLGHVHQHEVLSDEPYIAFPGIIQGRHVREAGPKGCILVTVDDDLSVDTEFRALDVIRWERAAIDLTDVGNVDEVLDRVCNQLRELHGRSEGRPIAVRIQLCGESTVHGKLLAEKHRWTNEIRSLAIEASGAEMWIEKVKFQTTAPTHSAHVAPTMEGPIGELLLFIRELRSQPGKLQELDVDFSDVLRKLPAELQDSTSFDDPAWVSSALDEAEHRLVKDLLGKDLP